MIQFIEAGHRYESIDGSNINWRSVTSLVHDYKQPFDADKIAEKCSKNKRSKWYGLSKEEILGLWKNESDRAVSLGTWYHAQRENDLLEFETLSHNGLEIPIIKPVVIDGIKQAPEQVLTDGVYPEHMVYLKTHALCGQSDLVEVANGIVDITDYKTNKEIKTEGFKSRDGKVTKMLSPVSHLDDCHISHYTLQLSMYMYMILRHNPRLKPGQIKLHHVVFEESGKDKYDYPITKLDIFGEPVVKEVKVYHLPYLAAEVMSILTHSKQNG